MKTPKTPGVEDFARWVDLHASLLRYASSAKVADELLSAYRAFVEPRGSQFVYQELDGVGQVEDLDLELPDRVAGVDGLDLGDLDHRLRVAVQRCTADLQLLDRLLEHRTSSLSDDHAAGTAGSSEATVEVASDVDPGSTSRPGSTSVGDDTIVGYVTVDPAALEQQVRRFIAGGYY